MGTLQENVDDSHENSRNVKIKKIKAPVKRLVETSSSQSDRIVTSFTEFNRVMGGGIVKDSLSIITAVPGAGKIDSAFANQPGRCFTRL